MDSDVVLGGVATRPDGWLLSAWLRNRYQRTKQQYTVADRDGEALPVNLSEPPVLRKLDASILFLADRSDGFGSEVSFHVPDFSACVWARPHKEAQAILAYIVDAKLANRHDTRRMAGDPLVYSLTQAGWERAHQLRPVRGSGRSAFVAMNFSVDPPDLFDRGIQPAFSTCGYEAHVVNREHFTNKIDDQIMAEIRSAALLLADFTGQKQNVYFETGFALGLGVPVIWSCHEDDVTRLHFDVRQYPCLLWRTPEELRGKLEARIAALYPLRTDS